ncbi:hypothetical protein D9M68_794100 [compost metagenome]
MEDWKGLKADTPCIVILKNNQDFVFKQLTIQKEGRLLLKSMNTAYQPYTVAAEEVLEIWKYHKHQTGTLPEATDMEELKSLVLRLSNDVKARGV